MSNIKIQNISLNDAEQIIKVLKDLTTKKFTKKFIENNIKRMINDVNCICVVLKDKDIIIGTGSIILIPTLSNEVQSSVQDIVVIKSYRGLHLGEKMLLHLETEAKKKGASKSFLTSKAEREEARTLYKKLGYNQKETGFFVKEL